MWDFRSILAERLWWMTAGTLIATLCVTFVIQLSDRRTLEGASVWAKPLKFEFSLAVHFATLALITSQLGSSWRDSRTLQLIAVASIISTALEVIYIFVQAARQQRSHFSLSTPTYARLYFLMAAGAVVITAAAGAVGLVAILDDATRLGPATRLGVELGLIGGTMLTFLTAFSMGSALDRHVGVEAPGVPRMPVTGWSMTVGDRRVPHFFATHMMQALPLAGLALDMWLQNQAASVVVVLTATGWCALTMILIQRAKAGRPAILWPRLSRA